MIVYRCECGRSDTNTSDSSDDWSDVQLDNLSGCVGPTAFDCPGVCPVCVSEGRNRVDEVVPESVPEPE